MAEIKGLLSLLKSLPTIISFLLELKKLWDEWVQQGERREKLRKFKEAVKQARDNGNTVPIVDFLNVELRRTDD